MGITRDIYQSGSLDDWQTWTLVALNVTTFLITVINLLYLCKKMPKAHQPAPEYCEPRLQDITSVPLLHRQKSIHSVLLSTWRTRVIYYFYIMPLIPLLVSYMSHYGAQYPSQSIWIFPALDIVIAVAFLAFMNLMIISCDGMNVIQFYLEPNEDPSRYKCGRKPNAFLGFKSRFKYTYLIVLKPFVDYTFSYFQYYYGTAQFQKALQIALKVLIIICTAGPVQGIKMFHDQCHKLSRMKRTHSKTNFVMCLAPGIQIQQLLIAFLFNVATIPGFSNVEQRFRWCCLYGMVVCFEMVLFAAFVTFVFHPTDLMLWDDTDVLLAGQSKHEIGSGSAATKTTSVNAPPRALPMEQTD